MRRREIEYQTVEETVEVSKNILLDQEKILRGETYRITYNVTYEVDMLTKERIGLYNKEKVEENVKPLCVSLKEVTVEELQKCRKKEIPSFVLKTDGKLYWGEIPYNLSFVSSTFLGKHMCASPGNHCHRLSAAKDEDGGCEKVRKKSTHIERYEWIRKGFETFNTSHDAFLVLECTHFEDMPIILEEPKSKKRVTRRSNYY